MFLKVPAKIIVRFGENNVLGTIYIDIYKFWRGSLGGYMVHLTFLVYFHKNEKSTRA